MLSREPIPEQPDSHKLGRILNDMRREIIRGGMITGVSPIVVSANGGGYTISYAGQEAVSNAPRFGMLRTDLNMGRDETCEIEEYTQDAGGNWCTVGDTYTGYDPLGAMEGTKDLTGCEFVADAIRGDPYVILKRVTCNGFYCLLGQCDISVITFFGE